MPTLNKILGLPPKPFILFFYSNENKEPPHIHVEHTQGGECKIWLEDLRVARNWGMPAHQEKEALRLVTEYKETLLTMYRAHKPNS